MRPEDPIPEADYPPRQQPEHERGRRARGAAPPTREARAAEAAKPAVRRRGPRVCVCRRTSFSIRLGAAVGTSN